MSRILLGWELGLNLGHLARLLPVAARLKERGHAVMAAVRDLPAAMAVLGPAGIPLVQAPMMSQPLPLPRRLTGYADILLAQGWADPAALSGLLQGWRNLYRLFKPDAVLLDYSPTGRLASRIKGIPTVLLGNGFELPPATDPLPHFPGFSWATAELAARAEQEALANVRKALWGSRVPAPAALRDLLEADEVLLATFAELDHYGPRENGPYVGPLLGKLRCERIGWPEGEGPRLFACLRPDTHAAMEILGALAKLEARVVCFAPGFTAGQLEPYKNASIRFTARAVDLDGLAPEAEACASYGAEGTVAHFLLAGVPQLLSPKHVEAHLSARRIEALGAGLVLRGEQTMEKVAAQLNHVLHDARIKRKAQAFAERYGNFDSRRAVGAVVDRVEKVLGARETSHGG